MKRLGIVTITIALTAGGFGLGIAVQHAHDQAIVSQLVRDNTKMRGELETAQREAQNASALAATARDQATNASNALSVAQAQAAGTASDVKAAERAGFMRGFCTVAFAVGTPEATLGQVVTDDTDWSACKDGIGIALKVSAEQSVTEPLPPMVAPTLPPALPPPVFGGILCSDGWVSNAAHRQGACSWHGGIAP